MALLTKNNLIYFGAALIVGACLAFGIASTTYEPVPLQVLENPYQPIAPPAPAVTVLPPQFVPGSMASQVNTTDDPYAPAPAPVIVTTAPLPTITPVATAVKAGCVPSQWNASQKQLQQQAGSAFAFAGVIPITIIGVGILMIIVGCFSGTSRGSSTSSPLDTSMNTITSDMHQSLGISGLISLIVAIGGVLVALYVISIVVVSIQYAVIGSGC
jgi:hypothetical protein